jgi:hypothetical protein
MALYMTRPKEWGIDERLEDEPGGMIIVIPRHPLNRIAGLWHNLHEVLVLKAP